MPTLRANNRGNPAISAGGLSAPPTFPPRLRSCASPALLVAALLVLVMLAVLLTAPVQAATPSFRAQERRFLELINASRSARGLSQLAASPAVDKVARAWSRRMAGDGRLRHNPNVSAQLPSAWTRWGENVGWAANSGGGSLAPVTARMHRGFMESPGHRANILGRFNQVGIGVAVDARGTMWATMVFVQGTRPRASGPSARTSRAAAASAVAALLALPASPRRHFTDVTGTHAGAINALADAGIVSGCAADRFCPNAPLSRAQLASMLERGLAELEPVAAMQFTDLPADYIHTPAINALAKAGITRGCANDRFCPTARVTRAQLAVFLQRAQRL